MAQDFFDAGFQPRATRYIGTKDDVVEKLEALHKAVRFDRFQALDAWGGMPPAMADDAISRFASVVAPAIRALA